ncbi:MAG TPA: GrpB family protein [Blastocatellia bacterium]|nr:GrpB family protein [Blastocatellia bacterium]
MSELKESPIGVYEERDTACHEYDARAPLVAARVAELIHMLAPEVVVEHVGSTAVPGLAGKGVIDLMVLYPPGALERAKAALDQLGFQRQGTRDPWPESRPMRLGALRFDGETFRLHAHVIAADAEEVSVLRGFRDRLRYDPQLRAAYVERKRAILESGVTDSVDYSYAKSEFIQTEMQNGER